MCRTNDKKDAEVALAQRKTALLSQQDFGITLSKPCDLGAACAAMRGVSRERAPITKFVTLRNVVTFISEEAKRCSSPGFVLAADDLLPLLAATIAQSGCSDIFSHVDFMDRFGWTPKSTPEFPYLLVTMQAAISHLISISASLSTSTSPNSIATSVNGSMGVARNGLDGLEHNILGSSFSLRANTAPTMGATYASSARLVLSQSDLRNVPSSNFTPPLRRSSMASSSASFFSSHTGDGVNSGGGEKGAGGGADNGISRDSFLRRGSVPPPGAQKMTSNGDSLSNPPKPASPGPLPNPRSNNQTSTSLPAAGASSPSIASGPVSSNRQINLAPISKPTPVTEEEMGSFLMGLSRFSTHQSS